MSNHTTSTFLSSFIVLMLFAGIYVTKAELAASRAGTMMGGLLCSVLFVFILTAISNMQMSSVGDSAKVGLIEVVICLLLAALTAASVHRVAVTVYILMSMFFIFILSNIAQTRYSVNMPQQSTLLKKKK